MGKTEDEGYPKWLEEQREGLKAKDPNLVKAFDALVSNEEVGKEFFRGTLREAEFHRRLNENHAEKEKLQKEREALSKEISTFQGRRTEWTNWYNNEKKNYDAMAAKVAAYEKRQKSGSLFDDDDDLDADDKGARVSRQQAQEMEALKKTVEELNDRLQRVDNNSPVFTVGMAAAMAESHREGFDVDPDALAQLALQSGIDPRQAYYQMTHEQRQAKVKAEHEKALKEAEERGFKKAITERPSPDFLRPSGPSVVDRLTGKAGSYPTDRKGIVDSAVEEFRRLRSEDPELLA